MMRSPFGINCKFKERLIKIEMEEEDASNNEYF
jgi:hypothetical protein